MHASSLKMQFYFVKLKLPVQDGSYHWSFAFPSKQILFYLTYIEGPVMELLPRFADSLHGTIYILCI